MNNEYMDLLREAKEHLSTRGVTFGPGLTDSEVKDIEGRFSFSFPPDLRWFLQEALPISDRFPNWRGPTETLFTMMDGPIDGICFDIKNQVFWWHEWGQRPKFDEDAIRIAKQAIEESPKLIPVFGHSYLPSAPCESGNPIFSVNQADVIHRGGNLAEYLFWIFHRDEESDEENYPVFSEKYRWIPFWSALAKENAC